MAGFLSATGILRRLVLLAVALGIILLLFKSPGQSYFVPLHMPTAGDWSLIHDPAHDVPADAIADGDTDVLALHKGDVEETVNATDALNTIEFIVPPRSRVTAQLKAVLEWEPPVNITDRYPPYEGYEDRDYDPNRWEGFELNYDYYLNGSIKQIPSLPEAPVRYAPYPKYNSATYTKQWEGQHVECDGPPGAQLSPYTTNATMAYRGSPAGFPMPQSGSFEAIGLDNHVCFDRFASLGYYGLGNASPVTYSMEMDWMDLQNRCVEKNKERFANPNPPQIGPSVHVKSERDEPAKPSKRKMPRTAVLIRAWDTYVYHPNDIQTIRSLITELSLISGGEYHVFLFVNVKNVTEPIFSDQATYDRIVERSVPMEFREITVLWSEAVCRAWYPNIKEHRVVFQQWMPLQYFSKMHPEFEYIWNWEMDARYIGNHYHFLDKIAEYSRKQPRKYLWERNARFYFPAVHGSYDSFTRDTNRIVEESPYVKSVWGPQPWSSLQKIVGPLPPHEEKDDNFEWGVGEEADFISLLPIFDPQETFWSYRDKLWGYPKDPKARPLWAYPHVPRRTFINTVVRLSKTLLNTMHAENVGGFAMVSEMFPASITLQHGLKGVYAPHPIWLAHKWPTHYLDEVFNADGWGAGSLPGSGGWDKGRGAGYQVALEEENKTQQGTGPNKEGLLGRWSQERDSVYSPDREHNFGGWSWYFWSDFPHVLYWRWLGMKAQYGWFPENETRTSDVMKNVSWPEWEKDNGRLCYPAMLLHPVKDVWPPPQPEPEPEPEPEHDPENQPETDADTQDPQKGNEDQAVSELTDIEHPRPVKEDFHDETHPYQHDDSHNQIHEDQSHKPAVEDAQVPDAPHEEHNLDAESGSSNDEKNEAIPAETHEEMRGDFEGVSHEEPSRDDTPG